MVSGKRIWMGVGIALRLAGMGGNVCLYRDRGGGNHRHSAGQRREYEIVSGNRYRIITPVLCDLLAERRKICLEMGRQKITEFNRTKDVHSPPSRYT
jgi:hypothetical protein